MASAAVMTTNNAGNSRYDDDDDASSRSPSDDAACPSRRTTDTRTAQLSDVRQKHKTRRSSIDSITTDRSRDYIAILRLLTFSA